MTKWVPSLVLRNWMAQHAIQLAEGGQACGREEAPADMDFNELHRVLCLISHPYLESGEKIETPRPDFPDCPLMPQPDSLPSGDLLAVDHVRYDEVSPGWMKDSMLAVSCSS